MTKQETKTRISYITKKEYRAVTSKSFGEWKGGIKGSEEKRLHSFYFDNFQSIDQFEVYIKWAAKQWFKWSESSRLNYIGTITCSGYINKFSSL